VRACPAACSTQGDRSQKVSGSNHLREDGIRFCNGWKSGEVAAKPEVAAIFQALGGGGGCGRSMQAARRVEVGAEDSLGGVSVREGCVESPVGHQAGCDSGPAGTPSASARVVSKAVADHIRRSRWSARKSRVGAFCVTGLRHGRSRNGATSGQRARTPRPGRAHFPANRRPIVSQRSGFE